MTANITFQCFWGQQPAAQQDSQSWVGCGKTMEITALDINLSVLSCHAQQPEKPDSRKGAESGLPSPLKRNSCAACCTEEHRPFPWHCSTHWGSPTTSLAWDLQRTISWPCTTAGLTCNWECKRDPKRKMHTMRAGFQATLFHLSI